MDSKTWNDPLPIPTERPSELQQDIDENDNSDGLSLWESFYPTSYPRASSFGNAMSLGESPMEGDATSGYTFTGDKWMLASPMTHHVIRMPRSASPHRLRKRRSRSFSDYIETKEGQQRQKKCSKNVNLPTLTEVVPPKEHFQIAQTSSISERSNTSPPSAQYDSVGNRQNLSINGQISSSLHPLERSKQPEAGHPFFINVLYGIINATIVVPVVMSFGNIIYQDSFFAGYSPVLIKLTMVSGVVHQLCFSSLSGLTFAVGSVQDAGLIFLSSMASQMVQYCLANGHTDDEVILATVTIGLALAAFWLGCGLVLVGKLHLAGYVQMLPTCVVAGYLAYIGFFCGKSGLGLMVVMGKVDSDGLTLKLLLEHFWYVLPGVVGGIFIYLSVRTFRHVAVLPTCIIFLLLCFYATLFLSGATIEKATEQGWIRRSQPAPVWYKSWDYLQFDKVVWSAFPQLFLTEISMLFVVALSSSLDVAAIELELNKPLDYNKEMTTVGISNVVSGMTGGYTGSYIFSQSIFSLRSGIRSRVAGFCLAACQILVIVTPIPILSFVPNLFYGSLLGMICLDLMIEWLWDFRTKVTLAEYLIGLSTFVLIQWLGVEYGILAGVALYAACRQMNIEVGNLKMVTDENEQETDEVEELERKENDMLPSETTLLI